MNVIGQSDNFQSYTYNKIGISLDHPPDWKYASLKNGFQLIKENNSVYLEIRKSNSEPLNTTLEQLALNTIQERFSSRKDFQVLNLSKTSISGSLPAYKAVYEFLKTPNENPPANEGTTNKVLRITTFANGVAYIIKYVSEKNKYDSYLPIADKIIDSLKFNVQENVRAKSDNNNNINNNNHKSDSLKNCFDSLLIPPPCLERDNSITFNCKGDRHFKSKDERCMYWNKKTGNWDVRFTLKGDDNNNDNKGNMSNYAKIKVGYGDLGGYTGKGEIIISNDDTGEILVDHKLNFAKLRASEGNKCCYKFYTFDKHDTHNGDTISAVVIGGGGRWESGSYTYQNNLHIGITLDEIGEGDDNPNDGATDPAHYGKYNGDLLCDSDKDTKAPSCDELDKQWNGKHGDDNNGNNYPNEDNDGNDGQDHEVGEDGQHGEIQFEENGNLTAN